MKYNFFTLNFLSLFVLSSQVFADINVYSIAPCRFWAPDSSSGGFVCQNIPNTIPVPQATSVTKILKEQNEKIAELEKKITELAETCKPH